MSAVLQAGFAGDDAALRRSALTLHALAAHDRGWLLAKLPASQRDELERLLAELRALGIPAEPRFARKALEHDRLPAIETAPATAQAGRTGGVDALDSVQAGALAQLLQHEPATLIAYVVGLRGAAGEAVLEHLAAPKRRQVQELLLSPTARAGAAAGQAPLLSEALTEELSARLASRGTQQTAPGLVRSIATLWRSRRSRRGKLAS